ncbi:putative membrane protein [Rhodovulum imhoffii]|uniref:Putative membrane protein n=1 Tax=Rhodovulum imhoffii TaxID=365340 RepID=A0A2T5BS43_9RHOB|nr:DUF599 domain-containing protein [Rhodovulum imhoffii]MBK5933529.1 hypothetical protein [Rhodovulum imhoffii]PTN02116.1 putative membrane protein [Rhodovulum imhoffii]
MEFIDRIALFSPLDATAVAIWVLTWLVSGFAIERGLGPRCPSASVLMKDYRRDWMHAMAGRDSRMFDSGILSTLRQGTTFFASASMILIGSGLALIGNTERLLGVAEDLTLSTAPAIVWEVKILVVLLFVTNAFLKFVWSHRLFGYCAVLMGAVPNDTADPQTFRRADQAAKINMTAARSFNRGLRALYFALGGLAWLLGAVPLMLATLVTVLVLLRREFASQSRRALLQR